MLPSDGIDGPMPVDNVRNDELTERSTYTGASGHPRFFTEKAEKRYYGELMISKSYAENRRKMYYEEHKRCCTIF